MKIEVKKRTVFVDGRKWDNKPINLDYLGETVLNILFYMNREGDKDYTLIVNGKTETDDFKKQLKEKYENILNTNLKDSFFKYARIK